MTRPRPVVAIDGPAGAGKTTVTALVAERLGYVLIGTGSLYRAVALAAERAGITWDDAERVGALAEALAAQGAIRFAPGDGGAQRVLLHGEDVSLALRSEHISQGASRVSALPAVRQALLAMQRAAGKEGGVVLEGRDIGTVVFPDAEAKFFLTASVEVRAERRYRELVARGASADLAEVRREVETRDRRDTERPVAPLERAPDADLVDSSALDADAVVERIVARVRAVAARLAASA